MRTVARQFKPTLTSCTVTVLVSGFAVNLSTAVKSINKSLALLNAEVELLPDEPDELELELELDDPPPFDR